MAPYVVQSISTADAVGVARSSFNAFYEDIHWKLLWSVSLEEVIAAGADRNPYNFTRDRPHKRQQKAIDSETGELVGYARWILPEGYESAWTAAQVSEPSPEEAERFKEMYDNAAWHPKASTRDSQSTFDQVHERITKGKTFLILDYLAVHPVHKGRGVASLLIQSGLAQADANGLATYVKAKNAAVNLYTRFGFRMVDRVTEDDTEDGGDADYTVTFLIRPAIGSVPLVSEAK